MTEREKWQRVTTGGQVIDKTNNSNLNQTQRMTKKRREIFQKLTVNRVIT